MAQTIEQWINEAHAAGSVEDGYGTMTMLSLVHLKGIAEQEVHTVRLTTGKRWTAKELATVFQKRAETYCEQLSGVQMFYLLAFYENRTEAQNRKPYRVNGQTDLVESMGGTEGPTPTGLTQQNMRHTEAMFQLSIRAMAQAYGAQENALNRLTQMNEKLLSEVSDSREIIVNMMLEKANKSHEHNMEELRYRRSSAERGQLLTQIPALVNTIFGREIFPQGTEDTALMNAIAEEMDVERIQKLLGSGIFSPKLMGLVATRMERYLTTQNEKDKRMKKLTNGIDPEKEVMGEN